MSKGNRDKRKVALALHQQQSKASISSNKPYYDHDPDIKVELTDDEEDFCIRVKIADYVALMHTRTAIDLSQKLQKAIADWIGTASVGYLLDQVDSQSKKEE